jgi:biopolymer transport protein ExbB
MAGCRNELKYMRRITRLLLLGLILTVVLSGSLVTAQESAPAAPTGPETKVASEIKKTYRHQDQTWVKQIFGVAMWPMWACSIVLVGVIFERRRALQYSRVIDDAMIARINELVGQLKLQEAQEEAAKSSSALGKAWAQAFHEFSMGGVALMDVLTQSTLVHFKPLRRNVPIITTIGVIAPLMGLIGTVVGMILTFTQVAGGDAVDKAKLAEGLSFALYKTAAGLIIAIPAIIAGRYFSARIARLLEVAEAAINQVNYRYKHAYAQTTEAAGKSLETVQGQ